MRAISDRLALPTIAATVASLMWTSIDVNRFAPGEFFQGKHPVSFERWIGASNVAITLHGACVAFGGGERYEQKGIRAHRAVIVLLEASTGRELHRLSGHTDVVTSLAFSDDGLRLASVSAHDSTLKLWEVSSGSCLATQVLKTPETHRPRRAAWLPDGGIVTAGTHGIARFTARLKPAGVIAREGHDAGLLAVSADGARAVTLSGGGVPDASDRTPPPDGALVAWDLARATVTASCAIDPPVALAMSRDGASVAVIHAPHAPLGAEAVRVASKRLFNSGMFHPIERYFDPSFGKRVSVFEGESLTPRWSLDLGSHAQSVVFSPDGAELCLVGRRDNALVLSRVRASDGALLEARTHPDPVRCDVAALALGGATLVAGTYYTLARFELV